MNQPGAAMILPRFGFRLAVRVIALVVTAMLASIAVIDGGYVIVPAVLFVSIPIQVAWLLWTVQQTNRELARFFDSTVAGDFSTRHDGAIDGLGFDELGGSLNGLMERMRDARAEAESERRYLRAVLDQVPVPLLAVDGDRVVEPLNHAARRLLGSCHRWTELAKKSPELIELIEDAEPGDRRVIRYGEHDRLMVSMRDVRLAARSLRLVSLQSLHDELEAAELEAWQQLVRVLTHELMNSLTPIQSLTETAAGLLHTSDEEAMQDAREALNTAARRAQGLLNFVAGYRRLSRLPKPDVSAIELTPFLERLLSLMKSEAAESGVDYRIVVEPPHFVLHADPSLLEHVLINLLRNAVEASATQVSVAGGLDASGRARLEIRDDGSGMVEETAKRAFVPFFTTKRGGSGVGLSLARQLMRAHGGRLTLVSEPGGGTVVTLTF
ncbi:MAG: ATP-binding protein [Myxococcota bacterium]